MGDAQKYTVVTSGEIGPGCDIDQAKAEFAELFKTTVEKSEPYFQGKRRVLRKDLGQKQAEAYEEALSKIGIISDLLPQQAEEALPKTSVELSVVAMEPKKSVELSVAEMEPKKGPALSVVETQPKNTPASLQVEGMNTPQGQTSMICPKCKTQQELADACASCGIIVEKYRKLAAAAHIAPDRSVSMNTPDNDTYDEVSNTNKVILITAVVSVVSIAMLALLLL